MKSGDIALASLPQADGQRKLRPVLLLKELPGHGDWLACGISSQLWHYLEGWDILLKQDSPDFTETGLKTDSVIRLGFLAAVPQSHLAGRLGQVSGALVSQALVRLSDFLREL